MKFSKFSFFFAGSDKKPLNRACDGMYCPVLLRHDVYCPVTLSYEC